MKVRSKREAEELAYAEGREREWEARKAYWAARGWKPMHQEPFIPPMWQCLRCSCPAFDRDLHDAWHASLGQSVSQ